ncbi:hypothetical protein B0H15DRAFT_922943 [Mycena belliarum]|uniref:Cyclin N-terminal domain-containing protein n=1 Tax=Mycena belliarum TaxID=1033014 RepID=A0AAD6XU35_9AGAR|nr:hypothetical protein B0H15DRAFT_922943 [Mycena belliae]
MSSSSSRLHPASLVDPARHSPALMQISSMKISRPVVDYVVHAVATTVNAALTLPPAPRGRAPTRSPYHAPFTTFAASVLARASVPPAVLLTALIYVVRARAHLCIALEKWALERVLLGALIAASKYTNDSALRNAHWATYSGVFGKRDIGRIEREFLDVLNWDLGVSEPQVEAQWAALQRACCQHREQCGVLRSIITAERPHRVQHAREQTQPRLGTPRPGHARNPSMPELEFSSPSSSDASLSPRTPDLPTSMDVDPAGYPTHRSFHAPRPAHAPPVQQKTVSGAGLHDLLRAFPMPAPLYLPPTYQHPRRHYPTRVPRAAS